MSNDELEKLVIQQMKKENYQPYICDLMLNIYSLCFISLIHENSFNVTLSKKRYYNA